MPYNKKESGPGRSRLERLDAFGQPVDWFLPGSRRVHSSAIGAICTILIYATLIAYSSHRLYLLIGRNDYQISTETQKYFFDQTFRVDPISTGFNVAAAVTSFGGSLDEEEEDPDIGTLEFYIKSWDNALSPLVFTKLKSRQCTLADFGLDETADKNGRASFNPLHTQSRGYVAHLAKMKCIDEPYEIYGDFNTEMGASLMIAFEKCDPEQRSCKENEAIEKWMELKYILTVENEEIYQWSTQGEGSHQKWATTFWTALQNSVRTENPRSVNFKEISSQNDPLGISFANYNRNGEQLVLGIKEEPSRVLPYANQIWNAITYELSSTRQVVIQRHNYSLFEWFGDIGGLFAFFFSFLGPMVISVFASNMAIFQIAKQLIDTSAVDEDSDAIQNYLSSRYCPQLRLRMAQVFRAMFCGSVCKQSKVEKQIEQGQRMVEQELDVVRLIKRILTIEGILKEYISVEEWAQKSRTYSRLTKQLPNKTTGKESHQNRDYKVDSVDQLEIEDIQVQAIDSQLELEDIQVQAVNEDRVQIAHDNMDNKSMLHNSSLFFQSRVVELQDTKVELQDTKVSSVQSAPTPSPPPQPPAKKVSKLQTLKIPNTAKLWRP